MAYTMLSPTSIESWSSKGIITLETNIQLLLFLLICLVWNGLFNVYFQIMFRGRELTKPLKFIWPRWFYAKCWPLANFGGILERINGIINTEENEKLVQQSVELNRQRNSWRNTWDSRYCGNNTVDEISVMSYRSTELVAETSTRYPRGKSLSLQYIVLEQSNIKIRIINERIQCWYGMWANFQVTSYCF